MRIRSGEKRVVVERGEGHPTRRGGHKKNITSYYPFNMIDFGEKIIFFWTPYLVRRGLGVKKDSGF